MVVAPVAVLGNPVVPAEIAWLVVQTIVNPVDAVTLRRLRPDICKKLLKRRKQALDAPGTVIAKVFVVRVVAALLDVTPGRALRLQAALAYHWAHQLISSELVMGRR
jgi:hypothetical protein